MFSLIYRHFRGELYLFGWFFEDAKDCGKSEEIIGRIIGIIGSGLLSGEYRVRSFVVVSIL